MNNELRFRHIKRLWHLKDGIIYTRHGNRPIKFKPNYKGYLMTDTKSDGKRFAVRQHEAVFMLFHDRPIAEGKEIHHIDGDRQNNVPDNLIELTPTQHQRIHKYQSYDPLRGIDLDGGSWKFRWCDDNGCHRARRFHSINEAMKFRAEIEEPRRQELRALGLNCKRAGNRLTTATMRQINKRDRLSYRCRH